MSPDKLIINYYIVRNYSVLLLLLSLSTQVKEVSARSYVIEVIQDNGVIDSNPIINFTEVTLFKNNGDAVSVFSDAISFKSASSIGSYLPPMCNDGITETVSGSNPINMCLSSDVEVDFQTFSIGVSTPGITIAPFDKITFYNAYGINNTAGYDIGYRILGATISVVDTTNEEKLYWNDVFRTADAIMTFNVTVPTDQRSPTFLPTRTPTRIPTIQPTDAPLFGAVRKETAGNSNDKYHDNKSSIVPSLQPALSPRSATMLPSSPTRAPAVSFSPTFSMAPTIAPTVEFILSESTLLREKATADNDNKNNDNTEKSTVSPLPVVTPTRQPTYLRKIDNNRMDN